MNNIKKIKALSKEIEKHNSKILLLTDKVESIKNKEMKTKIDSIYDELRESKALIVKHFNRYQFLKVTSISKGELSVSIKTNDSFSIYFSSDKGLEINDEFKINIFEGDEHYLNNVHINVAPIYHGDSKVQIISLQVYESKKQEAKKLVADIKKKYLKLKRGFKNQITM